MKEVMVVPHFGLETRRMELLLIEMEKIEQEGHLQAC